MKGRLAGSRRKEMPEKFPTLIIRHKKTDLCTKGKKGISNRQASHKMSRCNAAVSVCTDID
jgi:hypothetical protein